MGNEPGKDFEGETVVIDSDGDIYLEVSKDGANSIRFLVVSQVLWTASPVFRCMFGPRSKFMEGTMVREAQVNGTQPPSISCDDPEAFGLVLNILHHRCESVPEIISVDMFVEVATITDKYDMRCALSLWALVWLERLRGRKLLGSPHVGWLFVAWIFQWQDVFSSVVPIIVLDAEVGEAGNLLVPARSPESELLVLHTVPEIIPKHIEGAYPLSFS